jgi:MFS family permease
MTTGVAAMHAYQADCTLPAERARIFSLSLGILFIGLALGPTLGSFLIAATGNVLSVFYAATTWHICYTTFVVLVLPESLVRGAMLKSRRRHAIRLEEEERTRRESEAREGVTGPPRLGLKIARKAGRAMKRIFAFMSPLSVFAPKIADASEKAGKKDFSLTLVAIAYGFYSLVMVSWRCSFS